MTLTPIQKFCIARSVKLHAEQEELKYRDEVLRSMQAKGKPAVVQADGRTFLVSLERKKYLSVVEVEEFSAPTSSTPTVEKTTPIKSVQNPKRLAVACSKTFAKAMTVAAHDEGWDRSRWAENVIPEAYLVWTEDGELRADPEAGDSQVVVTLSAEVFAQVEDVGKAIGVRSVGAAFRRLIAYSLPNGGRT